MGEGAGWPLVAVAAALSIAAQFLGLYLPSAPGDIRGADKVLHALGFALPVVLVTWADMLRRRRFGLPPRARVLILVVWVSAVHAVLSEVIQHTAYTGRSGDPADVLADWSGIAIGGVLAGTVLAVRQWSRGPAASSRDRWSGYA